MSTTSLIMMIITVAFYGITFGYFINKAFGSQNK